VYPPRYGDYPYAPRLAPLERNKEMAGVIDHAAAFVCGWSRGTTNMIAHCFAAGVSVEVYVYDEREGGGAVPT